jgi:hypothetical protein
MSSDNQSLAFFANEHDLVVDYAEGLTATGSYIRWLFFFAVEASNPKTE